MTANLRRLLAKGKTLVAPGASDALSARLIEAHGYECVYIGSYATAAARFAMPDTGLLSLEQLAAQAKTIADAVRVPVHAVPDDGGSCRACGGASPPRQAVDDRQLAARELASDTRPLEDFLGYKDAPGRSRK